MGGGDSGGVRDDEPIASAAPPPPRGPGGMADVTAHRERVQTGVKIMRRALRAHMLLKRHQRHRY